MGAGVVVYPYDRPDEEIENKHEACLFYGWSQTKKCFYCTRARRFFRKDSDVCTKYSPLHSFENRS